MNNRTVLKGWKRVLLTVSEILLLIGLCFAVLLVTNSDFLVEIKEVIGEKGISADALRTRVGEDVSISIVYSSFDDYSREAAFALDEKLEETEYIKASCFEDTAYDPGMHADLTLFLGHTLYCEEDYLSAYERLGPDGIEISEGRNDDGNVDRLYILCFNETSLKRGIDSFTSYFLSASRLYKALNTLCFTEKSKTAADLPERLTAEKGNLNILSVSYPAADSYSLALINRLCEEKSTDYLVFNGGLACASTRDALSENWTDISSSISALAPKTVFRTFADENGTVVSDLAKDVIGSVFADSPIYEKENTYVMVCTPENEPLGFIFHIGTENSDVSERINHYIALAERAARHKLASVAFMQDLPASAAAELPSPKGDTLQNGVVINESYAAFVSESAEANYSALKAIGCKTFVFAAGYTNTGVFETSDGCKLALNGSADFNAPGVGGGFALNNSLRGAINIVFDFSGEGNVSVSYVYASSYGLTVKNVG